ncbi:putative HNHc nuclease [Levilactobacillus sp. HBUAS67566]|uniref:putative HNHc nuclease n=1 Tax=Levilactobacillus sp. HBUAS67566 TaxID=3109362 RepID=UPI002FEE748D
MQLFGKIEGLSDHRLFVDLNDVDPPAKRLVEANRGQLIELNFDDGRHISAEQRKKVFALLHEIDRWCGNYIMDMTESQMKYMFMRHQGLYEEFSLSDCSLEMASRFIEFLLGFCFAYEVPIASKVIDSIREQYGWDMYCLKYHCCMICGAHADIAHVHAVGIGRNRNHINNVGNYVMALCRKHHQEQHNVGIKTFMIDKKLKGVKVTPEIQRMLKIGAWNQEQGEAVEV